jgi:hypothetical protein
VRRKEEEGGEEEDEGEEAKIKKTKMKERHHSLSRGIEPFLGLHLSLSPCSW